MVIEARDVRLDLTDVSALIFTSEVGVRCFTDLSQRRDLPAWCVGDRTTDAARQAGLDAMSAQGTADDLVALIGAHRPKGTLLHLHGAHTRGDVVARLQAAGHSARGAVLYDQIEAPAPPSLGDVLTGDAPVIVPLFSPRSAALFARAAGALTRDDVVAIALSAAVKAKLPADWMQACQLAAAPDAPAMIGAIERLISRFPWVEGRDTLV
jgi:uroporphyrinogen-III synthase